MKKLILPFLFIIALPLTSILSGCNVKGFFTSYDDDPVYESPVTEVVAGAETGGSSADASPGAKTFKEICSSCHQSKGQGVPGTYPPLAGSAFKEPLREMVKPIMVL